MPPGFSSDAKLIVTRFAGFLGVYTNVAPSPEDATTLLGIVAPNGCFGTSTTEPVFVQFDGDRIETTAVFGFE